MEKADQKKILSSGFHHNIFTLLFIILYYNFNKILKQKLKRVIIASQNPVKINSVKNGFEKMFPEGKFIFEGITFPSGVSDQPMTNDETMLGALNRATSAKSAIAEADFWIGIEGGLERVGAEMEAFAWVVIKSNTSTGKARTGTFFLPPEVIKLINEGKELGDADDIVFGHSNSKQKMGAVGILTHGLIDRTAYYTEAVILALIPFKNKKLYGNK